MQKQKNDVRLFALAYANHVMEPNGRRQWRTSDCSAKTPNVDGFVFHSRKNENHNDNQYFHEMENDRRANIYVSACLEFAPSANNPFVERKKKISGLPNNRCQNCIYRPPEGTPISIHHDGYIIASNLAFEHFHHTEYDEYMLDFLSVHPHGMKPMNDLMRNLRNNCSNFITFYLISWTYWPNAGKHHAQLRPCATHDLRQSKKF